MPEQLDDFTYPWDRKRPGGITVLSLIWALVSLFYLVKFSTAIWQWDTLKSLSLSVPPIYLALDGLVRGSSAGFLAWSLWAGKPWSRTAGAAISLALVAATWLDLIILAEPLTIQTRWPVNLVLTLVGLPGFWALLSQRSSQAYFRRNPVKIP